MDYTQDIPASLATAAYSGTSFTPDERGARTRTEYAETLTTLYAELLKHATTPEKVAILDAEFATLRAGYAKRYRAFFASESRCVSVMIAGPSNFPSRRMEKRNNVAHKRLTELCEFLPRAKEAILKALHPEWRPIMAGDADATERLDAKIAKAEAEQERMKAANAAIRKHKAAGPQAQVAALVALGFSEGIAVKLLEPDFCGRIGFPNYLLTNNNANIRRMKQRAVVVSRNQATQPTEAEGANARLEDCPADNRVRLFFPSKPSAEIRTDLKRCGFRWSPTIGAWQAYRNLNTLEKARVVAGVEAA